MRNHAKYFTTEAPKSARGKFMKFGGEVGYIRGFLGGRFLRDKGGGSTVRESIERSRVGLGVDSPFPDLGFQHS